MAMDGKKRRWRGGTRRRKASEKLEKSRIHTSKTKKKRCPKRKKELRRKEYLMGRVKYKAAGTKKGFETVQPEGFSQNHAGGKTMGQGRLLWRRSFA